MNNLEISKAIAELEGVKVYEDCGTLYIMDSSYWQPAPYMADSEPSINLGLRNKYEVSVNYPEKWVACGKGEAWTKVYFDSKDEVPEAVLICILKSEGKWND